ncbi:AAA family ATPase [Desulfatitalea alkaliphila]|uniref:Zinc-ribbon domain-containing protein n=1 Tax=Desulfatitalea alkaliphila TaxID=2929485 RepID=A0AA41UHU1_9BACT|nr:AAA family ATPase [Desulfatitalea alkaliphila]MCJ8499995.1 zinc-ribbon domain-containing protein [Desulfatitalea alkaliphila]
MIVVCPNCQTQYDLEDRLVQEPRFIARCTKCRHLFSAYRPVRVEEIRFLDLAATKRRTDMANIVAVSNQKGGVAKTSTCLNLGFSLAREGKRVLLVDFDVQANLTISLGYKETVSFYEVLSGGAESLEESLVQTKYQNLWLFPSNKNMVLLNKKYFGAPNFEFVLKDRLLPIKERFDYIVIDTPPSIEFLTLNALTTAHQVVIPSQCDYLSTHGIDQILKLIGLIKAKTNPAITAKVLITMFEKENTASKMICAKLNRMYADRTFETIIELDPRVREAQIMGAPVLAYNAQSKAGLQYGQLAKEMIRASDPSQEAARPIAR